ncbi:conserved protein of unknown function [Ectopseudomonas oleovorans]|uniref:Uncharacterized protein n=1 Tax=Ectopseudomonas oleovorans TaxID=301 RepID=A0A653BCC5_ECTOL|nr:conserved protein of unknown function [Pseudomonas oleovorans]
MLMPPRAMVCSYDFVMYYIPCIYILICSEVKRDFKDGIR